MFQLEITTDREEIVTMTELFDINNGFVIFKKDVNPETWRYIPCMRIYEMYVTKIDK